MFGFFASQESKMRRNAANWLELADKVWALRRDVLPAAEAAELARRRDELRASLKARADAGKLKLQIETLEAALRRSGGAVYPKSALVENVEFLVVAAIVILGIRTYFIQPFKIPTNSMWPTYYGMTGEVWPLDRPAPGPAERLLRLVTLGAWRYQAVAPTSGNVSAAFLSPSVMAFTEKPGRSWLIFPAMYREYTFYVDGVATTVDVPQDFGQGEERAGSFEDLVIQTYFGSRDAFNSYWAKVGRDAPWQPDPAGGERLVKLIPLGRTVRQGDPVLRFDILTGDQLFVDRFSYHFFPPKPGQGFVFRTDHIELIGHQDYYIKRLVGVPGDVISIRPPVLYRNGRPITGSRVFALNADRVPPYTGYTSPSGEGILPPGVPMALPPGGSVRVPPYHYFPMGDNSSNSYDGRYWGFVPGGDVIGRPLFIYYPFTRRWGPAQ